MPEAKLTPEMENKLKNDIKADETKAKEAKDKVEAKAKAERESNKAEIAELKKLQKEAPNLLKRVLKLEEAVNNLRLKGYQI